MADKILVIDDDPALVQLMTTNLEEQGYRVLFGYDGQMAIQMARNERPRLIILDVNMPMTNGLLAAQAIRSNAQTQWIPIILLTGETSDKVSPKVDAMGRVMHLKKPVDLEILNSIVRELLQRYPAE